VPCAVQSVFDCRMDSVGTTGDWFHFDGIPANLWTPAHWLYAAAAPGLANFRGFSLPQGFDHRLRNQVSGSTKVTIALLRKINRKTARKTVAKARAGLMRGNLADQGALFM
jgi:hypothetical protein